MDHSPRRVKGQGYPSYPSFYAFIKDLQKQQMAGSTRKKGPSGREHGENSMVNMVKAKLLKADVAVGRK